MNLKKKTKIKEIIILVMAIFLVNTAAISIVVGGYHISPHTVSWFGGFITFALMSAILARFDIYLDL